MLTLVPQVDVAGSKGGGGDGPRAVASKVDDVELGPVEVGGGRPRDGVIVQVGEVVVSVAVLQPGAVLVLQLSIDQLGLLAGIGIREPAGSNPALGTCSLTRTCIAPDC